MICEQTAKTIATLHLPAVINTGDVRKEWEYSAIRFLVTDQANPFLVQYITSVVRS